MMLGAGSIASMIQSLKNNKALQAQHKKKNQHVRYSKFHNKQFDERHENQISVEELEKVKKAIRVEIINERRRSLILAFFVFGILGSGIVYVLAYLLQ